MNNITKYNIQTIGAASITLVLLLCLASCISAPTSDSFFEAINPWSALVGLAYVLSYLGLPIAAVIAVEVLLLLFVLFWLYVLARRVIK